MSFQLFVLVFTNSCAYQFSNLHTKPPKGIKTIAFEAVYDTSQKVRPHEIIWESLQRAFAANGKLRITSTDKAEAFLQTRLVSASSGQGEPIPNPQVKEDKKFDANSPSLPRTYRKLTQAAVLADRQSQNFRVEISVWHLKTKELLFRKSYALASGKYPLLDNSATKDNQFLRSEEIFTNNFILLANKLAAGVVRDFLRGR